MEIKNTFKTICLLLCVWLVESNTMAQCGPGEDIFPPTFNEALFSLDIYEDCEEDVVVIPPTVVDNCTANPSLTIAENDTVLGPCPNSFVNSITYRAEDELGNFSLFNITVHVMDQEPPVFDQAPNELNQTVSCEGDLNIIPPTAADNCGIKEVSIFSDETEQIGDCAFNYTRTITYRALDECLNFAYYIATYTVQDNTAPIFDLAAGALDQTVSCQSEIAPFDPPTATDNCGTVNVTVLSDETLENACSSSYQRVITYQASDACGNTSDYTTTIIVNDDIAPVFTSEPGSLDIAGNCGSNDLTEFPKPVASDNCSNVTVTIVGDVSSDGDCQGNYTRTITYQATDACGNASETFDVVLSIGDNTPPSWTTEVGSLNAEFDCSLIGTVDIPLPVASDDCGSEVSVELIGTNTIEGACAGSFQQVYNYQAIDDCGNVSAADFSVTLSFTDNTPPILNEEAGVLDILVSCSDIAGLTLPAPTATDNCGQVQVSLIDDVNTAAETCAANYSRVLTYQVSDDCGNVGGTYDVTITVVDDVPPTFSAIFDENVSAGCGNIPDVPNVQAFDNCDTDLDLIYTADTTAGSCAGGYIITRTWTATDDCDNQNSITQTIAVEDNVPPVITGVPSSTTVDCNFIPEVGNIQVTDNCDNDLELNFTENIQNQTCANNYTLRRVWQVVDDCNNETFAIQELTVIDTVGPVFDYFPADIQVSCNAIPEVAQPTAIDQCAGDLSIDFSESFNYDNCPYILTRTWTATDDCNNTTSRSQIITLIDEEAPQFSNVPISVSTNCNNIPEVMQPSITDNCDTEISLTFEENIEGNGCPYTIIRTWTATDDCGNIETASQSITVEDNSPPQIQNVPEDVTLSCSELPEAPNLIATDDCAGELQTNFTETINGQGCELTIIRTWTAVDLCNNEVVAVQNITVSDDSKPVFEALPPQFLNLSCTDDIPEVAPVTASDDCDTDVTIEFTTHTVNTACAGNFTIYRSWTAEDDCDNREIYVQTITVSDETAPSFMEAAGALNTAICTGNLASVSGPSAQDNCSGSEEIELTHTDEITTDNCSDIQTINRTWVATDECGNSSEYLQVIQVFGNITANINGNNDNCAVQVSNFCAAYTVQWTDDLGNSGNGDTYTPQTGTEGIVTFTLSNPNAPVNCGTATFEAPFNCANTCPQIVSTTPSTLHLCSGMSLELAAEIINEDGGTLNWYGADGTPITDPSNIVLENNSCENINHTFTAEYIPNDSNCPTVSLSTTTVTVYPEISFGVNSIDCEIHLVNLCPSFIVTWTDGYGKPGDGPSYIADPGSQGFVEFTIYNPNATQAPIQCQLLTTTQEFHCGDCPSLVNPTSTSTSVCSGSSISLEVDILNNDGGSVVWYYGDGTPITNPSDIVLTTDNCNGETVEFYAEYTSTNANCELVTSDIVSVNVYPEINATIINDGCTVALNNLSLCNGGFEISWEDTEGNMGTGPIYNASNGHSGTLTFTVTNTNADAPNLCNTATFVSAYTCQGCPSITLDVDNPTEVCYGAPVHLTAHVDPIDGNSIQWFHESGVPLDQVTLNDLNYSDCTGATLGYYAAYQSSNDNCPLVETEVAYVQIHPQITASASSNGCTVTLEDYCQDFTVSWEDSFGNTGTGDTYAATNGENGTVTFLVNNPNGIESCNSAAFVASFDCSTTCPEVFNPACNPPVVCEGEPFSLIIGVANLDGGTLQWYDENDNPITNTEDLTINIDDCDDGQFGYYAAYTPANSSCSTVTTEMAYVTVYPQLPSNISVANNGCNINIVDVCDNFEVTWFDNTGANGDGQTYTAAPGTSGNVVFTISNPASGVPATCLSQTYDAIEFECANCPNIYAPACDPPVICQGETFNLTILTDNLDGGTVQWYDENDNLLSSSNNINIDMDQCEGGQFGYYATYTPANSNCPSVTTSLTYVNIFPNIEANIVNNGCEVIVEDYCTAFPISWEDDQGNTGVGNTYNSNTGDNGTITFTIENPSNGAPANCQSNTFTAEYACVACPEIFNPACDPPVICQGETFGLVVGLNNLDGGTLQWYDQNGDPISNTENIMIEMDACTGGQFGYYAEYTPSNASCATVTTDLAYVNIYPQVSANITSNECEVILSDYCADFTIEWTDDNGNSGNGNNYAGTPGESGNVSFTITNPNAPANCASATYDANYDCPACPQIVNPACSPATICAGEPFSLTVETINPDGGTLQWFDEDGNAVDNPEDLFISINACIGGSFGYYVEYTPANADCPSITSDMAYVQIYPQINASVVASGCNVILENYCDNFEISWEDEQGNTGNGAVYNGETNSNGTVTFTVTNPNNEQATMCMSNTFTAPYSCADCPQIFNPACSPPVVCEGETFGLVVGFTNLDGGSLQWYDEAGNPVNNTEDIVLELDQCAGGTFGYYVEYTPANADCPTVTTDMAYVTIYPQINAEIAVNDCEVNLSNYCEDFNIAWFDSDGNTGSGDNYTGSGSGTVTFTVSNPGASGNCLSQTFNAAYNCDSNVECPQLINPTASTTEVCSGSSISLEVELLNANGGTLEWFDGEGNLVDPNNIVLHNTSCNTITYGFYAVYTLGSTDCPDINTSLIEVNVYPEFNYDFETDGCTVTLTNYCENFWVNWISSFGKPGNGPVFYGEAGETGTVEFSIYNSGADNAPIQCQFTTATFDYSCDDCPGLINPNASPNYICEGELFELSVAVTNNDGGTLTWYTSDNEAVTDPSGLSLTTESCGDEIFGFYAEYVPSNSSCPSITSATTYVHVYPEITANVVVDDCDIFLTELANCEMYEVTWEDNLGASGTGSLYTAVDGSVGSVTFTVTNLMPGTPDACLSNSFSANFDCGKDIGCPFLEEASISETTICSGEAVTLDVVLTAEDGGTLEWFDQDGNTIDPNNVSTVITGCTAQEMSFYAEYYPATDGCPPLSSNVVTLLIYPQIEVVTSVADCMVSLTDVCEDYAVTWSDDLGNNGTGVTYTAQEGTSGTVTFTVTNPNGIDGCESVELTENFSCAEASIFDLALTKTLANGQAGTVTVGDMVTFTITVYNQGNVAAQNIQITDYIPNGLTLADSDWMANGNNATTTINGPLMPGDDTSVDISFTVDATVAGTLTNFAEISGAEDTNGNPQDDVDSTPDNNNTNDGTPIDNATNDSNDEDDHDPASIVIEIVCPQIINPSVTSNAICAGESYALSVEIINEDGGILEWFDQFGNTINNPNDIVASAGNCQTSYSYYATYTPAQTSCTPISTIPVTVTVYPEITANINVNECQVDLDDFCSDFVVSWTDSFGNSGNGDNYIAQPGQSGTVTFTVNNTDAPEGCQTANFTAEFDCAEPVACPTIYSPVCNPPVVCSGQSFALNVALGNPDGGTLQWFDENDNPVADPSSMIFENTACENVIYGFYAQYTPANTVDCPIVTTELTYVSVYPSIEASVTETDCQVDIITNCNYTVNWIDTFGDSGSGNSYSAQTGQSGTVTFTVSNPNAPENCQMATYFGSFDCAPAVPCPSISNPIIVPSIVCSGEAFSLSADVNNPDEGNLQWYDQAGNPIADPNNVVVSNTTCNELNIGYYAIYTPSTIGCGPTVSQTINVTVYPEINATVNSTDCQVSLGDVCNNFTVTWSDNLGNSGNGTTYTTQEGNSGTVNFTVSNPNAPAACQTTPFSGNFNCPEAEVFDLALTKALANNQSSSVSPGDLVTFTITVYNQGNVAAQNVQITDYIPSGLTLSDANWNGNGSTATTSLAGPIQPGASATVDVSFTVNANISGTLTNFAEISGAQDTNGNPGTDVDSTPDANNGNDGTPIDNATTNPNDEDDHDPASIKVNITCPTLGNPVVNNNVVCNGQTIALSIDVIDGDGGSIQWYDQAGNTIANPNNVVLNNEACNNTTQGFYAVYTSNSAECGELTSGVVNVSVYPQISANVNSTDCQISLNSSCNNFTVTWTDNLGNSGNGTIYTAQEGTSGTVNFTVSNPNAPATCQAATYTGTFNCAATVTCPSLGFPTTTTNATCSGGAFALNVSVGNDDGGSLTWYHQSGTVVSNPNNVVVSNTSCSNVTHGYYAIYTPSNNDCTPITSATVQVEVYPNIDANVNTSDCQVYLSDICSNFNITWSDNLGNSGNGATYTAQEGTNGTVSFTVSNPNAPATCQTASFNGTFNCAATVNCPSLGFPTSTTNTNCSNGAFALNVAIGNDDGGILTWYDQSGNVISNPNNIVVNNTTCNVASYGYYAIYTPSNNNCTPITSATVQVEIYPSISAVVNTSDCQVYLSDYCTNFNVAWSDNLGNTGTGASYIAAEGQSGSVSFNISNSNAPVGCQTATYSGNFNCPSQPTMCPELLNPTCSPNTICEGETFSLSVGINNPDGGSIQWFDQAGNPLTSFSDISIDVNNCQGGQFGYYAEYTPSDSNCPVVTSPLAFVVVHPEIFASFDVSTDECMVDLDDFCSFYEVSWMDSYGNTGTGDIYNANEGQSGSVTFTVNNPNAPEGCASASFTSNFNCMGTTTTCPDLENAQVIPPVVCSGQTVSLSVNIFDNDGGILTWYDNNGNSVSNPNAVVVNNTSCNAATQGFYAVYTPADASCTPITSMTTLVQVYPQIEANTNTLDEGCSIQLDANCPNFNIVWQDNFGNTGSGTTYTSNPGQAGTVNFTVSNLANGVPSACGSASFSAAFNCPQSSPCPILENPVAFPEVVCSGGQVSLSMNVLNDDGGSITWYDTNDNLVSNPNAVTVYTNNCNGETLGYYAIYTPSGSCASITSQTVLVQAYPQVGAGFNITNAGCTVELLDYCPNFNISWVDDQGNTGTGPTYTATENTTGSVDFTIFNTMVGVPAECNSTMVSTSFACGIPTAYVCDTINYCTEPGIELNICPDFCDLGTPFGISAIEATSGCIHEITDANCISYIPYAQSGTEILSITACNTVECQTVVAIITIDSDCDNDTPLVEDDYASTQANTSIDISVLGNDNDPDGDALIVCDFTEPLNGIISVANGVFTYTPNNGFAGTDVFSYTVCDGNGGTATALVYVTVAEEPGQLSANADSLTILNSEIIGINILGNDFYPAACNPMVVILNAPQSGFVTINDGGIISYEPQPGFVGDVVFTYQICCGSTCDIATVKLKVGDDHGCEGLILPNGFSPNGDGVNETFDLKSLDNCFTDHNVELRIFNRFGEIIFQDLNYTNRNAWTGQVNNRNEFVPEGTYFFTLRLNKGESLIEKTGSIRIEY